jgi:hypothetical protein
MSGEEDWMHPMFWVCLGVLCLCGGGVMYWLKIVYSRFEVTEGLPIEYVEVEVEVEAGSTGPTHENY